MLAIGRPIGRLRTPSATALISPTTANVVLSVGPYPFSTRSGRPAASTARNGPGDTASPPTISVFKL